MSEQLIQTPCLFGDNGNFLLERELGTGGMGGVYMGRDKMLDRPVAVKIMLKELGSDAEFVERFKKEAQSVARLIHPNIAQVYSYGICDGMPYIAMELASGGSLFSLMNANPGKTDVTRVIKICQQVAQALQCAADQGLVHGDVKPENILLDANGNAKLVDFGLAAMQKETNEIWGTPYYIAPEKVKKEPVDFRADMYSLGGTLYHALTGVAPFEGDDSVAVVRRRFEVQPRKPSELRPELSPAIDKIVMTMLTLDPSKRYPSFEALLQAFRDVLTSGLSRDAAKASATGTRTTTRTGARRMTTTLRKRTSMNIRKTATSVSDAESYDEGEEEGGGNLGLKVLGFVVGIVVLLALVGGGLYFMTVASAKSEADSVQSQIVSGVEKARAAIADTVDKAGKFADEFDTFAQKAVDECQKSTDELVKLLPEEQRPLVKPPLSKELLDAIASTNVVPPEVEKPVLATTNAPAATPAETNVTDSAAAPEKPVEEEVPAVTPDPVVLTMNELWQKAYSCQACAIRIRRQANELIAKGAEAENCKDLTRESMTSLGSLSATLVEGYERLKGSPDVETVKKGIGFIKTRGEKAVLQTLRQIKLDKLKAEREAKAAQLAQEEAERKKKMEEERKALIEQEVASAKEKFDAVVNQGCLRQLDWKSALRLLQTAKDELKTAEGQLAYDFQIRKVNAMKHVQDIFIQNLKGYTFKNGKLRNCRIETIDDKEIVLYRPNNQPKLRLPWPKLYKELPGNLNEMMNLCIVNTRKSTSAVKMALRDWADAMSGSALTMQLVCAEAPGAAERAVALVKTVIENFPEYAKTAREMFPDMELPAAEEE